MNAEFSPLGALILVAWLATGGFAVYIFVRQPHPTGWHWASLIVGMVMLALGAVMTVLAVWTLVKLWQIKKQV